MTTSTSSSTLPILLAATPTSAAEGTSIELDFNLAMAVGSGVIYVTDGALQTVIDRATGLPTTRVVGGTDTHVLSAADLVIDGTQVTLAVNGLLAGHTYSLVMGAGTLVSGDGMAFGGLTSTSQMQFTTPPADAPPPLSVSVASLVFTDTGLSTTDGVTSARAEHFDGTLSTALTAGQYVELTIDGHSFGTDDVIIDPLDPTHWTFDRGDVLADGQHTLSARVVDGSGNAGAATSVQMVVDTVAPTLAATSLHGNVDPAADVVIQFSEPVYWTGDSALLTLGKVIGGVESDDTDIAFNSSWFSSDHKTLTISAAALDLDADTAYHLTFTGGLADLAANALGQAALDFTTGAGNVVVTPPTPPTPLAAAPVLANASDSGIKGDNITNDTTPTITGTAAAGMKKVNVYDNGVLLDHANVNDDGTWSITVNNGHALGDGVHQLTVRESDGKGGDDNYGTASAALALTIDTIAPTVTATHTSLQGLKTVLSVEFSESIVFGTGAVNVSDALNFQQAHFAWDAMTNWDIANNAAGVHSVLELNLGLFIGPSHLSMDGNAIQDVAGNVAIIGNSGYINPVFSV